MVGSGQRSKKTFPPERHHPERATCVTWPEEINFENSLAKGSLSRQAPRL